MEAVKKLQNSTKLLQKVTSSSEGAEGSGYAWSRLPRPEP